MKFSKDRFEDVYYPIFEPIVDNLKSRYNRPRPIQLAGLFGININVIDTGTHSTPAYPSGHTAYAAVAAYMLSAMYPHHSSELFRQIGIAGYARCLQGVHYPSDNDASMVITGAIWENIKYDLFPDLFPEKVG